MFAYAAKTATDIAFYEMRRNLNSDASNLNLVARSFCEMPCSVFALRMRFFSIGFRCRKCGAEMQLYGFCFSFIRFTKALRLSLGL